MDFNIFKRKHKLIVTNPPKEHLNFTYNSHNEDHVPFDEQHFMEHEPAINGTKQKNAIASYKRDSYHINKLLWGHGNDETDREIGNHVHDVLKTSPEASDDFHVYTGVSKSPKHINGNMHIPAFTSATPDHRVAGIFASAKHTTEIMKDEGGNDKEVNIHHVIKIHVKKGQKVGGYIGDIGTRRHEKEFLINRGHTLHFNGTVEDHIKTDGGITGKPAIYRVHHATITPDE